MADFNIFYNQVLFGTIGAGIAIILVVWLTYRGIWRPREMEEKSQVKIRGIHSFFHWLFGTIPWAVIVAVIGSLTYTIVHIYHSAKQPPNM